MKNESAGVSPFLVTITLPDRVLRSRRTADCPNAALYLALNELSEADSRLVMVEVRRVH